jgi:hypothetical protein
LKIHIAIEEVIGDSVYDSRKIYQESSKGGLSRKERERGFVVILARDP